jgi:hypothetical protein
MSTPEPLGNKIKDLYLLLLSLFYFKEISSSESKFPFKRPRGRYSCTPCTPPNCPLFQDIRG